MKILYHRYILILLVVLLIPTQTASIIIIIIIIMYLAATCVSVTNLISYRRRFIQEQYKACKDGVILRCVPVFASWTLPVWSCCLIQCGHIFFFVFACSCVNVIEFYYHRWGGGVVCHYISLRKFLSIRLPCFC